MSRPLEPTAIPPAFTRRAGNRRWLRALVAPSLASLAIHATLGIVIGTVAIGRYIGSGELQERRPAPVEVILHFDEPSLRPASERSKGPARNVSEARSENSRRTPSSEGGFDSLSAGPSSSSLTQAHEQSRAATPARSTIDPVEGTLEQRIAERLAQVNSDPSNSTGAPEPSLDSAIGEGIRSRLAGGGDSDAVGDGPPGEAPPTSFAGLKASNALSVVYVVDASGSLISTLPVIRRELERSLRRLSPEQRFGVAFFQKGQALLPTNGAGGTRSLLRAATKGAVEEVIHWAEGIRPSGRSNPLAALELALAARPDVVFLLSTDITGAGEFELSGDELLRRLDVLNPLDPATGRRPTRIQCIQFLDPDPHNTLKLIAEEHSGSPRGSAGDAASGYRFLSREALGLLQHEDRPERGR